MNGTSESAAPPKLSTRKQINNDSLQPFPLTLSSFRGQEFLALAPPRVRLFLLYPPPLVVRHGLPELAVESVEDPEALFQFERVGVFAEELRQLDSHPFQFVHVQLQIGHFSLRHLQELGHLVFYLGFRRGQLDLFFDLLYPDVEDVDFVQQLLHCRP